VPLFAAVGVGVDAGAALLVEAGGELAVLDAAWLILGRGERRFEEPLASLARRHPNRVAFVADADEALVHRAVAGADFLVAPALADPSGAAAMIALRHGTLPVVAATGGLDDVVVDYDPDSRTGSGFKLAEPSAAGLVAAVKRALALYREDATRLRLAARAMELDFSWDTAARRYAEIYAKLMEAPRS
jgi:starch synthase